MATIVYFEENDGKCAIRFVKSVRKKSFWRKAKVECTYDVMDALLFHKEEDIPDFVGETIHKDFPNAKIAYMELRLFIEHYRNQRFWVICRWNDGKVDFHSGNEKERATFTENIADTEMILSETEASRTLRMMQQATKERLYYRTFYLNLVNVLLTPCMMITCTGKASGETRYFRKLDGKRIRMVATSDAAEKLPYEAALQMFEYLQANHKNFLYAVLPAFKDNVNCKDIERYIQEKKVSRRVAMDFKLKHLNKEE